MKSVKKILSNQRGVALLMIMTAILFLTVIYGDFTFDSKISRLKATNILDRAQAKLLAESGLQMAMTRLRLYKEAYNTIQNNPSLQQAVPAQLLNQLWEVPYMFPIPVGQGASRTAKDSVEKFQKESLIDGEMRVTIENMSNRLNLNLLRYDMQKIAAEAAQGNNTDTYKNTSQDYYNPNNSFSVDQALFTTMKRLVDEKKEKDDAFNDKYGSIDYQDLFTNLKYYMSDFGTQTRDPLFGEAEQVYQRQPMTPKFGPMTSVSELYAVPGWDDQLIELIKNEFSVYPATQIDPNKVTANFLRILFPNLNEKDIQDFYLYKNDAVNPQFISSVGDLKKYFVDLSRNLTADYFDQRIKMFSDKGITFGSNPNLFKVISEGIFNRATYTLVATVVLSKQQNQAAAGGTTGNTQTGGTTGGVSTGNTTGNTGGTGTNTGANAQNQNTQLLEPKIIEIQVN